MLSSLSVDKFGNTLLHHAAMEDNLEIVKSVMQFWINPLAPNEWGQLAVEVAKIPEVIHLIRNYTRWSPIRQKTWWYGPYFEERAFAFLLVCKRHGNIFLRDICYLIIQQVAEGESTFVIKKKL